MNLFITYQDIKKICHFQVIDTRFQVDDIQHKTNEWFVKHRGSLHNVHVNPATFAIIIKHKETITFSDRHKITQIKVIESGSLFKSFL